MKKRLIGILITTMLISGTVIACGSKSKDEEIQTVTVEENDNIGESFENAEGVDDLYIAALEEQFDEIEAEIVDVLNSGKMTVEEKANLKKDVANAMSEIKETIDEESETPEIKEKLLQLYKDAEERFEMLIGE